jgi:glycosyltransferase involved in cell wall biosynthesis
MWQKGIAEYCEAAARIRVTHPNIRFQLLGPVEPESNKAAIPRRQVEQWAHEAIDYLGAAEDVRPFLEAADCVVLPSYYPEGVPRILIEAAAMGKPIITTNMPGCRDVIEPGGTGYLCEPGSVGSLVAAMLEMVAQSPEERAEMARRARSKMEREFDERIVIDAYLAALNSIPSS